MYISEINAQLIRCAISLTSKLTQIKYVPVFDYRQLYCCTLVEF